jgi:hypothetical protein
MSLEPKPRLRGGFEGGPPHLKIAIPVCSSLFWDLDPPLGHRQGTVFGGVGGQFVDNQVEGKRRLWQQSDVGDAATPRQEYTCEGSGGRDTNLEEQQLIGGVREVLFRPAQRHRASA